MVDSSLLVLLNRELLWKSQPLQLLGQDRNDSLVTIIGSAFFQPIADLIFKLQAIPGQSKNEVQVASILNGYASSVCLLAAVALESQIMRVRYINKMNNSKETIDRRSSCAEYIKELYSDFERFEELQDIFVLRDVIAHNHLWSIDFKWDEEVGMCMTGAPSKDVECGDKKYKKCVNLKTLRTNRLQLCVNPIGIGKPEVVNVIKEMWQTLMFLEEKDRNQCYVSHLRICKGKELIKISDLFGKIDQLIKLSD